MASLKVFKMHAHGILKKNILHRRVAYGAGKVEYDIKFKMYKTKMKNDCALPHNIISEF